MGSPANRSVRWGGNAATAGAQVPGTVDEVSRSLIRAIDRYLEDE